MSGVLDDLEGGADWLNAATTVLYFCILEVMSLQVPDTK
jgi:hypothetical protein